MPVYSIKAPDGNTYSIEGPDGASREDVIQAILAKNPSIGAAPTTPDFSKMSTKELEAMPSAPTSISDIARSFGSGVVGGAKSLADVFGAGTDTSQYLGQLASGLQKGLSPARQAEIAKRQELEKRAQESGSTLQEIKTFLGGVAEAPLQSAAQAIGSSAPTLAAIAAIPADAPVALGVGLNRIVAAAVGAAQGVGEAKGDIYDSVKEAYKEKGYRDAEAARLATKAQEYAADKALTLGGSAALGVLDSVTGMEGATAKALKKTAGKPLEGEALKEVLKTLPEKELTKPSMLGSAALSAAGEAPVEGIQGGFGQYAQNVALIKEGLMDPKLAMQGVYGAAARDAAAGLLSGGAFGPLEHAGRMQEFQTDQALRQAKERQYIEPPPPETGLELPAGYQMTQENLGRQMVPQGFNIMQEGREEPLSVVENEEELGPKLDAMRKAREQEKLAIDDKISVLTQNHQAEIDKLNRLEAIGEGQSEEANALREGMESRRNEVDKQLADLYEKRGELDAPISHIPRDAVEQDVSQFHVTAPDQTHFGTFKTPEQARAALQEHIGEEPFKRMEAQKNVSEYMRTQLVPQLRKFGLHDVGLKMADELDKGASGAYTNKLIQLAMDNPNPMQTMRHEVIHALKDLGFFTPEQWKALETRAKKEWIGQLKSTVHDEATGQNRHDAYVELFQKEAADKGLTGKEAEDYVSNNVMEEAIADAFAAYDKGVKPPPGLISVLYNKLKNFFANFKQAMQGGGFQSADDIFQQIERGKLKPSAAPTAEEKLSLRVAKKVGKQLDLDQPQIDSTSIGLQTGKAGVNQFKKKPVGGLPQVVQFLEKRRSNSGLRNLDINNQEDREELAKLMAAEAMAAINAGGGALQWYDSVIDSMMNMAALKYPELATNEDSKSALRMAIAIASQGLNVEDNLTFAMSQYDYFRKNGNFKEVGSGADGAAMKSNFILANQMIDQYGLTDLRKFLQTEFTVEELRGAGFDIGGELGDEKVTGSAIFGPKIGFGFYSNLSGNFEPVTMDMWFMRTIGRLSGKLKAFDQKKFDEQIKRFRDAMKESGDNGVFAEEFKDEEIKKAMESVEGAVNLSRIVNSVFNSDFINNRALYDEGARKKTNLVYAAQNIIKSFDAPKDVPQNGTERRLLRDVVERTVNKVAKAYGQRIPPASLQALIWYPEQELYKALGVKLRVTSQDYAGAIRKILEKEGYDESAIDRAAKSGSGAVQPVAGQQVQAGVGATGKKPQTAFEPSEREEFLEQRREEQVLKQEREAPRRKKVIFEVAPDPNNVELTERWKNLPQKERLRISNDIAKKIIEKAKKDLDFDGRVVSQVGSYLDDTNPSFALFLEKGDAVEIAKFIGYALSQDSMMVVSPRPAPGLEKVGAVVIDVKTQSPSEIDAIYQTLRDIRVNGNQPVGGQTTMNNKMIVLNYSGLETEELAKLVDAKLKGAYDVKHTDVYSAFPEKKDYDYASQQNDPRGKGRIVREGARTLRAEATSLLEKELGPEAKGATTEAGDVKYSLKAPNTHAFKAWFDGSKVVDEDGNPLVVYHGTGFDFDVFEGARKGTEKAYFFTEDPELAESFARTSAGVYEGNETIMPVYLRMKNPLVIDYKGAVKWGNDRLMRRALNQVWAGEYDGVIGKNVIDGFGNPTTIYAVVEPRSIKSATGNIGTYSSETADIRYSLTKVSFPTVEEAKDAAEKTPVPDTPEFKRFIAGSQWVDDKGEPMRFYHATAAEFFEFTPAGQSQAIFLATTPEQAETFGNIAEDRLRRQVYRALNKDEKLAFLQKLLDDGVQKGTVIKKDADAFMREAKRKVPEYGDFGPIEQETYDYLLSLSPNKMGIMPLWARAETPFDFENRDHVDQVLQYIATNIPYQPELSDQAFKESKELAAPTAYPEHKLRGLKGNIVQGRWRAIESKEVQQALRALGFDAFTVREGNGTQKNYAVYKPSQVKSITGNLGEYGRENKDIRYSLPALPAGMKDRLNEVAPQRHVDGWKRRVIGAFGPEPVTYLRQKLINRYESLAKLDRKLRDMIRKAGGVELLADQSAEWQALASDMSAGVAASAMGIGERAGGIPVFKNGVVKIDNNVKGLTEALAPLAKFGDPEIYQRYQFWAGWKRGRRLLKEGRESLYTPADAKFAQELEKMHPEFVQVQKDLIAFNNGIVDFAVQGGVLSKERGELYKKYADYIPFYRQLELDKTIGPNPFGGLAGMKGPKELKGGESPLADFLETMVRNTQSMINAAMKNHAAQVATNVAKKVNMVERLPTAPKGSYNFDVYKVLENGQDVYYSSKDPLLIEALKSLNIPELPFLGMLSAPANFLRSVVTKDPGFMMANLLRDSLSAYVTSGSKMTPFIGTMANFGKGLVNQSPGMKALFDAGALGGYELNQNIEQSGRNLYKDLEHKAGKDAPLLRPFKSLWNGLEKGTTASDAATRVAIYERVLEETGNEAEALRRAVEVMNFNRKGNSALIRIATAALPFFNARIQGLDVFYRAMTGQMNTNDAKEIQRRFFIRGATMMALSAMYYMAVAGDDDYEKQEQETKDNNWIIPGARIKIPVPFEVGTLFKTMPERAAALLMGNDTGKDFADATKRAILNTFAFNPIPQTFKPAVEAATNFNFFTMRPIVGQGMQDVAPEYQIGPGTSKGAEIIGKQLGVSPMIIDHLWRGYTGTMGQYLTDVIDFVAEQYGDSPKATKRFEQMPIIRRFMIDPEARGSVTSYYQLKDSVDTTVRTMNLLERTARPEEFAKYVQDNIGPLAVKDYVSDLEKSMKELRDMRSMIQFAKIDPGEKKEALLAINQAENSLTRNIQMVKRSISELK